MSIKNETRQFLSELQQKRIIKKSSARFVSPAFFIKKKTGDLRLVVDYRILNQHTIQHKFPIPKISDYLYQLEGSILFSQIDLRSGYYQVRMKESDIEKTAFTIDNQIYIFLRMPFGLVSAPSTFQRVMIDLLRHLSFVKVYLDDIPIHSKSHEEHLSHLQEVLDILRKNNAEVNFEKSVFCSDRVKYLGHIITSKGIMSDTSRINKFNIPEINTRKRLQKVLGFIN